MRAISVAATIALIQLGHADAVPAQAPIILKERLCRSCALTIRRSVRLGTTDGPGVLAEPGLVTGDSRGRFFVADAVRLSDFEVFQPNGAHARTLGGERGDAPGKYRAVTALLPANDSLFVFDPPQRRITVLGPGLQFIRSVPLPTQQLIGGVIRLPEGRFIVNANLATSASIGYPLHLISPNGKLERSFGAANRSYRQDRLFLLSRNLAVGGNGTVWVAHRNRYRIEHWSADGKILRALERDARWFRPHTSPAGRMPDERPVPRLGPLRADARGRLWVLAYVPERRWRSTFEIDQRLNRPVFNGDSRRYYDTVLEIINPVTGEVITRKKFDEYFLSFLPDGRLASIEVDAVGRFFVDIWRVQYMSSS